MEKISLKLKNILNNYYTIKVDKMRPETILGNKFNCNIKDSTKIELETESTINAFTDGSKNTKNNKQWIVYPLLTQAR